MEHLETKIKPKKKVRNNRTAGHNYEREVVRELRELGFTAASTSRLESRSRDNAKVDICNADEHINGRLPYNIQCKNVVGTLNYKKFLEEMPKDEPELNVVFHKYTKKSPKGIFMTQGQFVMMTKEDFYKLIKEVEDLKNPQQDDRQEET